MKLHGVLLRATEFHLCLREAETANLAKRQRCQPDFALSAGKTAAPLLSDVVLVQKKILILSSEMLQISLICIPITSSPKLS